MISPNALELNAELLPDASRPADMAAQLARLTRSAAHAANSPFSVMYLKGKGGFAVKSCFGLEGDIDVGAAEHLLSEATGNRRDGLLIINDRNDERGLFPSDDRLFGAMHPEIRFAAAAPIVDAAGEIRGAMIVADIAPRAGLSGATTYVLRTHASQICTILELESWRKSDGGSLLAPRLNVERMRLLESVVVNANESVLITDAAPISLPGPRIVYCNAAFTRTTGYTEEEVLGKTPRILQSERTDQNALAKLRAALVAWKPVEVELLNTTKDGVEFWVELSIAPVADEYGRFTHWISVQRDVSDRKNAEEATVRARLSEAANEALGMKIQ
jgi:PAS domain S-box-containing protein